MYDMSIIGFGLYCDFGVVWVVFGVVIRVIVLGGFY